MEFDLERARWRIGLPARTDSSRATRIVWTLEERPEDWIPLETGTSCSQAPAMRGAAAHRTAFYRLSSTSTASRRDQVVTC
jgi:hypothetical protein